MKTLAYNAALRFAFRALFSFAIIGSASLVATSPVQAAQKKHSDTGWQPRDDSVQWKVVEYGKTGAEVRYYFRNRTKRDVWVSGHFRYIDSQGKNRSEHFKVRVKANSKRGGQWDGFRFNVRPNGPYRVWELKRFRVTLKRP